jgi:uncharacterized protein (TIGR02246 family)
MPETEENERSIRELLERWASAVRSKDLERILADHDNDIVMFDVPPPFRSVGLGEYRSTWDTFYEWATDPVVFEIVDATVVADDHVAFAYASMHCAGRLGDGSREELDFRLTVGLVRRDGRWQIAHEHHSIPAASTP